jgi:hypothetical protein
MDNHLHPLDETLKALSARARAAFLHREHNSAARLAAEAREYAISHEGKTIHQLGDGSLALVSAGASIGEIEAQVAKDPSAALLGNQDATA